MQVVDVQSLGPCTATIYKWNSKFLLKFELDGLEQTYKISELDVAGIEDIKILLNDQQFLTSVSERFLAMQQDWMNALGE